MTVALDGEFGAGNVLCREGNVHDHGAAISKPLHNFVVAETCSCEIASAGRDIRDQSRDAIFFLRQVHRSEHDPYIEFQVFVSNLSKVRLDEQSIGRHVFEPFPHPKAQALVAGSSQRDVAVFQRISRSEAHPNGFTSCSLGMSGHRRKNEKPRLRADHAVETAGL